jgi:3-isopropylmalate/(R)-2-methylmalate dehydratase small subunit
MAQFKTLTSTVVPLLVNDIDTDQIIPARFLKVTDKIGLGSNLFADWRSHPDGTPRKEFVLADPIHQGSQILLTGDNFGCGSSREHAPWALLGFGFRAIISTSFADIFTNNALKNGLLPITVSPADHAVLVNLLTAAPRTPFSVDLATQSLEAPGIRAIPFPIDGFSKRCLLDGVDELGYLLGFRKQIDSFEQSAEQRL